VDVGAAFVAEPESSVLVEPGERALHNPALSAEPGTVLGARLRDHRFDLVCAQPRLGRLRLVAAVAEQRVWPALRRPRLPRTGGIASTSASSSETSWRFAAVVRQASGIPPASQIR